MPGLSPGIYFYFLVSTCISGSLLSGGSGGLTRGGLGAAGGSSLLAATRIFSALVSICSRSDGSMIG